MSAYQHRRNFSLLATQSQTGTKLKSTNRSLRKIQNGTVNNYSWLLVAARQFYHKTNNLESAIQNFEQYLAYNPTHQQSLYLCGLCYMQVNQHKKGIKKLQAYISTKSNQVPNPLSQHPTTNNRKLIIHSHSQLPQINHVYLLLSIAYYKINNIPKAMETINEVLKIDNKYEQAYCFRAKLYVVMGEFQKACFDYRQVLRWNQRMWEAWGGLGDYYTQTNNYTQAYKCYIRAQECIQAKKKSQYNVSDVQYKDFVKRNPKMEYRQQQKQSKIFQQKRSIKMHEKLSQLTKNPKKQRESIFEDQRQQSGTQMDKKSRYKTKLHIRQITSPTHYHSNSQVQSQSNNNKNIDRKHASKEEEKKNQVKNSMFFQDKLSFENGVSNRDLFSADFQVFYQEIQLKVAICLYFLGEYQQSIKMLEKLKQQKCCAYLSQIYYYIGANQQKLYNKPAGEDESNRGQLFQKSVLNFELSIRSGNNIKIMAKSCKTLLKLYIENNQFYETGSVIELAEKYELDIKQYKILSEACMLVIKQKYQQALPILKNLYASVIKDGEDECVNDQAESEIRTGKNGDIKKSCTNRQKNSFREKQKQRQQNKISQKCSSMRLTLKNKQPIKPNKFSSIQAAQQSSHKNLISSSGNARHQTPSQQQQAVQNQFKHLNLNLSKNSDNKQKQNMKKQGELSNAQLNLYMNVSMKNSHKVSQVSKSNELEWMIPVVFLFRAYAEFFSENFIQCLEVYEHYENFIKDYLGKDPDADVYLAYNKVISEGILMLENQMIQESLEKFVLCVENYYKLLKGVAVQPILFRILALMRLALSEHPYITEEIDSRTKIYLLITEILDHYLPAINTNPLVYYYYGLALYELQKYKQASDYLQKCLKIAEECTWKFLYVKGLIQIKNKLYKDAIREFSAGLLVEDMPELYLGRCICYIQLFEQTEGQQQTLMQKSFEDLQKFIELEDNKQKISKWVTKILFFNKAYEQVTKSIKKVSSETLQNDEEMLKIQKSLNIYNGMFEDGGVLGQVIINAFQGKFQDSSVEINGQRHSIILSDFVNSKYKKWLNILNLYTAERYPELIKFLQVSIFEEKSEEQALQLRYNLAIVYYLSQEASKADNVLAGLTKYLVQIQPRIQKFLNRDFMLDQCVDDLQVQLKGVKRLSSFLPYRKVALNSKVFLSSEPQQSIYVKISIPFPAFFKPDIDLSLDDMFIYGETAQSCIPKKIQAPWIKRVTGHVQFTDNIISSHNTSLFDQDVLSPETQSKEESSSEQSLIKNF